MKHDRFHTLIISLASLLFMVAGTGCVEPITPLEGGQDSSVTLTLQVDVPSAGLLTKASDDPGQIPIQNANESSLRDLWIWLFNGDATVGVPRHKTPTNDTVSISIPSSIIQGNVTQLSIYAVGNGPSIEFDGRTVSTPTQLQQVVISDDTKDKGFGKTFVTPSYLDSKGLPMSYRGTVDISFLKYGFTADQIAFVRTQAQNAQVKDNDYVLNGSSGLAVSEAQASYLTGKTSIRTWTDLDKLLCPKVELIRAVSRLRFLFAKETDLEKTVNIDRIQIGVVNPTQTTTELQYPEKSYLFPRSFDTTYVNNFTWSGSPLLADNGFLVVDYPMNLRSDSQVIDNSIYPPKSPQEMTAAEYEQFLGIKWGGSKQTGLLTCYLRESSRPIQGVIHYTVNKGLPSEKSDQVTFDLSTVSPQGFCRNLSNLVYAYFDSGKRKLVVDVSVLPWNYNPTGVSVSGDGANTLKVDQDGYLIVDPLNTSIDYDNPTLIDGDKVYIVPLPKASLQVCGHMIVYAPVDGTLRIKPVLRSGSSLSSFKLTVKGKTEDLDLTKGYLECPIDRNYDRGRIYVYVSRSDSASPRDSLELSFDAVTKDGRVINADSEIIDDRFCFVIPTTSTP